MAEPRGQCAIACRCELRRRHAPSMYEPDSSRTRRRPRMAKLTMKFGGTSVADLDRIRHVAQLVKREVDRGNQVAVVVSAMAGETNKLVGWTRELSKLHDSKEHDAVVATGEQVTAGLLAIALGAIGVDARSWMGWQIPMKTSGVHGSARIESIDPTNLNIALKSGQVAVVAGYQGIAPNER